MSSSTKLPDFDRVIITEIYQNNLASQIQVERMLFSFDSKMLQIDSIQEKETWLKINILFHEINFLMKTHNLEEHEKKLKKFIELVNNPVHYSK